MDAESITIYFLKDDTNSVISVFRNEYDASRSFDAVIDKTKYKLEEVSLFDLVRCWCDKARDAVPQRHCELSTETDTEKMGTVTCNARKRVDIEDDTTAEMTRMRLANLVQDKTNAEQTAVSADLLDEPITRIDINILRTILNWNHRTPKTIRRIAQNLGIGRSTAERKLRNLKRLRFINYAKKNRSDVEVIITPIEIEALAKEVEDHVRRYRKNIIIRG